ncbi:MAG: hypothetical protein K2J93_04875, partial [Anaeroplasmataceae bacterium]|nr:hypothetical protein [Anaeroplasmataceae bacterium]
MDVIRFFITWGPTFLFIVVVLWGILIGCLRGFRKSLILFIHMLAASVICLIVYLCIVKDPNLDANMVKFINGILGKFGGSLQKMLSVEDQCTTLHEMIMQKLVGVEPEDPTLQYWLIKDNAAYINTLIDMAYHLVIAILCYILYGIILFILYIVYLCAYPVRRKIKKETRKYQHGESKHPYKRRRLLGSLVGGIRATFTCIIYFSFLGSLIYIVTGGTNLPQRDQYKEEGKVEFQDQTWNEAYDYYSSVCAMGNTGIFQILNSIKDTNNTPFYFYFADIVLQGRINDETQGVVNDKFYIRDELGEYVHFINSTVALMLKYGNVEDIESLAGGNEEDNQTDILIATFGNEGFAEEFSKLVDEFEGKPFMTNLCLSTLTSLVNHIELAIPDNELVVGLVNQLFKSEDGIKVSDLATESDIKSLFKGLVQVVAEVNTSQNEVAPLSAEYYEDPEEVDENIFSNKKMILIAKNFIPTIQGLSLFSTRSDVGNKIIQGLYTYASTSMVEAEIKFEVPDTINWIDEFNILLNACDPLLTIAYQVYDAEPMVMMENLAYIFDGEKASDMEDAFDGLSEQLESSLLLDVVFKSSIVGKQIDKIVTDIAKEETAKIPKDIDYVGKDGECAILLSTLKNLLKNGGGTVLLAMINNGSEELNSSQIKEMLEVLTKEITIDGTTTTLIKNIINSKLVYYAFSIYLTYVEFGEGAFKLYLPENAVEMIEDCKIIKHSEIEVIVDLLSNCIDLIVEIIDHPTDLDYAHILSNEYIKKTVKDSLLLQGTLSNVIIGVSASQEKIILPVTYDNPESWISEAGDGEICTLLDAIFEISDVTIEGGKYLVNELLNGNIQPSVLLNIEKHILDQLCSSKVLRYTISDMVTDLNGFQIVVARASLEEVNALTTKEDKLVNVIEATELRDIFVDIQRIVTFEKDNEMKINYSAIFENKAELSKSKTITATLIQLLMDQNEAGFVVIPKPYQEDFEKFKTDVDLTGNIWLGESDDSLDDEIYLMLTAVETFMDKDENGKIPNEFDFDNLAGTMKLREDGIDDICASAILNASISKKITGIFNVPTDLYKNEVVEQKALNDLFKAVFKLFNRSEIVVIELDDDLFDLTFRAEATPIILNSIILRATITSKMYRLEEIKVPENDVVASEFVDKEAGYIANQAELNRLFNAMFKLLETDIVMVNDLEQHLTGLRIPRNSISYLTDSHILSATVSANLTKNDQLVILENVTTSMSLIGESSISNINSEELNKLLDIMFIILGTDAIVVEDISNQFDDLSISKNDVEAILESRIISATISKKIVEVDELSVSKHLVTEQITIQNTLENVITKTELKNLLSSMFALFDTEYIS